jgi:molybdopterin molybdotransferase
MQPGLNTWLNATFNLPAMPTTLQPPKFPPLRSMDDALAELLSHARCVQGTEQVSTFDADRRVLAQPLVSALDVPGFDNSAMDGYAVRAADCQSSGAQLKVTQRIAAGQFGQALSAGEAARIFTGAPVPPGADAVVMQEDCADAGDGTVRVNAPPRAGQWLRKAGEDITRGATVLAAGTLLGPAELGLAASIGMALFSTGDELVMPGAVAPEAMPPGAIYNSNRFFLRALLQRAGCEVTDMGIVPDQREATVAALAEAAHNHDLILTSGGVSVGEEDHIKPAVQQLGRLDLWSISMKPGKPFAYGTIGQGAGGKKSVHFIGLPGNPVSSLVTFLLLVRPMLMALHGCADAVAGAAAGVMAIPMRADFDGPKADKRREFLRARRNLQGGLDLFANQSSGVLTSVVWADGLIDNPAGQAISKGDMVRFIPLSQLL